MKTKGSTLIRFFFDNKVKSVLAAVPCFGQSGHQVTFERSFCNSLTYISLALLGIIAVSLALKTNARYGAGVSPDSAHYLSTAENLLRSEGYVSFEGVAYTHWPPLFPTVLAFLGLTGVEPYICGRFANAILWGVIVFLLGVMFAQRIRSRLLVVLGASAVLLSATMLKISVFVWSEPLFILLNMLFLFSISRFLKDGRFKSLLLAGVLSALSCLQRYIGMVTVTTGGVLILLFMRKSSCLKRLKYSAFFVIVGFLPIGLWFIRNALLGSVSGSYSFEGDIAVFREISRVLNSIIPWFITGKVSFTSRLVIIGTALFFLVAMVLLRRFKCGKEQFGNEVLVKAVIVFVLVFIFFTTAACIFIHAKADERMFSPMYVFLIFLGLIGLEAVAELLALLVRRKWIGYLIVMGLCSWWLISQPLPVLTRTIRYYDRYGVQGFNSAKWRDSPLINWLKAHPLKGQVFSNVPDAVYFWVGREARLSPRRTTDIAEFRDLLLSQRRNYLVWHYGSREYLYGLEELRSMFKLRPIVLLPDGAVFTME